MKIFGFFFGQDKIIQVQTTKFLFECSDKSKEVEAVKEKMTNSMTWNAAIALGCALVASNGLQRIFPSFRAIGVSNVVIDAGIFMVMAIVAGVLSLNEMESEVDQLRKNWIISHNPEYLKVMRTMNRNQEITLQYQINKYVPLSEQLVWKSKYD